MARQRKTDRAVNRLREIAQKRSSSETSTTEPSRPAGPNELCPPGYEHYGVDWGKLSPEEQVAVQWFAAILREIREREVDLLKLAVDCNRATITELQMMIELR